MTTLNEFGHRAYKNAVARGKVREGISLCEQHDEAVKGITEEVNEFRRADEVAPSEHLYEYSHAVEELVDIAIAAMTELHRRGIDIDAAVRKKMCYNESR